MANAPTVTCDLIAQKVKEVLPNALVDVKTDGYYFYIDVHAEEFKGLSPVKQQQEVYKGINQLITSGDLHAVKITTNVI